MPYKKILPPLENRAVKGNLTLIEVESTGLNSSRIEELGQFVFRDLVNPKCLSCRYCEIYLEADTLSMGQSIVASCRRSCSMFTTDVEPPIALNPRESLEMERPETFKVVTVADSIRQSMKEEDAMTDYIVEPEKIYTNEPVKEIGLNIRAHYGEFA